jgi:hypothetical protein
MTLQIDRPFLLFLCIFLVSTHVTALELPIPIEPWAFQTDAGLGFRVQICSRGVTLARTSHRIAETRKQAPDAYVGVADPLVTVVLGGVPDIKPGGWSHQHVCCKTDAGDATVVFNRLSPAVLFEIPARQLTLAAPNTDTSLPKFVAFVQRGNVTVHVLSGKIPVTLDEPWLLLWFGERAPLRGHAFAFDVQQPSGAGGKLLRAIQFDTMDLPLLVRLEHRPKALSVSAEQVALQFDAAAGKCAVMPLFGGRIFLPQETEAWKEDLPDDVLRQCRLWCHLLRDFPAAVNESFTMSSEQDTLGVCQAFQWISFQDDWSSPPVKAAPLPPMLALALGSGIPIKIFADGRRMEPVDFNLMDNAGPMVGIKGADAYEWRLEGFLKRFLADSPAPPLADEARPLADKLEKAVNRMVDSGHLRPLFYAYSALGGDWYSHYYWVGTPELAYTMAQAWPYLSDDLRRRVAAYMHQEWQKYPPFRIETRYYEEGTWRAPYDIPWEEVETVTAQRRDRAWRERNFLMDFYRIAVWHDATSLSPDGSAFRSEARKIMYELVSHLDWAIVGPRRLKTVTGHPELRFMNLQGSAAYNSWLAGAVGVLRLARRHNWQEEQAIAAYLAGKLAIARVAQARYVAEMHRRGLVRGQAEGDWRAVSHIDEYAAIVRWGALGAIVTQDQEFPPFIDLTEPVGRMLADYVQPESRQYLSHLDRAVPFWYLSEAPKQGATEHRTCPLVHLNGNVLAQHWILGRRGESFRRYVDTSRFVGDLYYLQNLIALIRSYGQSAVAAAVWKDHKNITQLLIAKGADVNVKR